MDESKDTDGSTAMERLARMLWCPMCGARYGWPACEAGARDGEAE